MNIMTVLIIGAICLGLGWLLGVKNINNIENLVDKTEQAVEFLEQQGAPDVDMMNITLNMNRNAGVSLKVDVLLDIETGDMDSAKEKLIDSLSSDYYDIYEDATHEMTSEESEELVERLSTLAKEYKPFKRIRTKRL